MAARPRLEHVFAGCVLQCCGGTINALGGARLESGIIKRGCIKVYKQQQGTDEQVEDDAGRIVQRGE